MLANLKCDSLIPTRYSLLSRLGNLEDQESWKDFFDTYWRLIYSLAIDAGCDEMEAQDVVQETVLSVTRDLGKFKRDRSLGTFKGWLRNIIRWRIADQLRKRGPMGWPGAGSVAALESIGDPASLTVDERWEREWQENLMAAAVDRVKRRVKEEHFQTFDLYVLNHWPVAKVAETMGVTIGYFSSHARRRWQNGDLIAEVIPLQRLTAVWSGTLPYHRGRWSPSKVELSAGRLAVRHGFEP